MLKLPASHVRKIAVFRALQLGDLLCTVPAFRALRHAYPDAEITLLGLPWQQSFVRRFHTYIDRFLHFPGYAGLPEQPVNEADWPPFVQHMRQEQFGLLLQLQGNGTVVNPLLLQMGATHVAGFHNADSRVDSDLFLEYPDTGHEIHRHLQLMKHLGIPAHGDHLEYPVTPAEQQALKDLCLPIEPGSYVCIHPGSRGAWRQWPPQLFAGLTDHCVEQGLTAVITGTAEETDITREVLKFMRHPAIDLTGQTTMGTIGVLIAEAYLLISNCTGVSHIAAATQTPSIVISMDGEPHRWAPLNTDLHKTTDWTREKHFDQVMDDLNTLLLKEAGNRRQKTENRR
jgi:ADP-heptose:LPS heptosyltransferase